MKKKVLIPLLVLAILCVSLVAPAAGETVRLSLNTGRLMIYKADSSFLSGLISGEDDGLQVIVLSVRKSQKLQVSVQPSTVRNKKVTMSVDKKDVVQVRGNTLTGQKPGEAVLTITSDADPSAKLQYRIVVVQPVTRITLSAPSKDVPVGGTMTLKASFIPENATRKGVTWASSNPMIAKVDENGVVTGVKRGGTRITATSADGSNIRANINVQVTQSAEKITLDKKEVTVDAGRTVALRATVLPNDTNDKKVFWSSSDERVARVNAQGRVTGVSLGDCVITCTSQKVGTVQATAVVHVQQPVKKVTFGNAPFVYKGETATLSWVIEPANASNPKLKLTSSNERILTVKDDGTVTGISAGEAYVKAVTTDGSNRQAKVRVKVGEHVTGVHMKRNVAYIDLKQTSTAGAILEPDKATNNNMTWESADPSIATVVPDSKAPNKAKITGVRYGETIVTGTTEDGGFQTSIRVKVGDWENALRWVDGSFDGRGNLIFEIRNTSELNITSITIEMEGYDFDGNPEAINSKNGSNVVKAVYRKPLGPGAVTKQNQWKMIDYAREYVNGHGLAAIVVRIVEFQIDNDWVKTIRKNHQPKTVYNPHRVLH